LKISSEDCSLSTQQSGCEQLKLSKVNNWASQRRDSRILFRSLPTWDQLARNLADVGYFDSINMADLNLLMKKEVIRRRMNRFIRSNFIADCRKWKLWENWIIFMKIGFLGSE
jgi:hypothetical protein